MSALYERDFAAWAAEQAGLLRAGVIDGLDFANLAEEVESMGKSEQRSLENRLIVLICHLLKWRYQPQRRGASWQAAIREQRLRLRRLLRESPSLNRYLQDHDFLEDVWTYAVAAAIRETDLDIFPEYAVWLVETVLEDGFLPDAVDGETDI